MIFLPRDEIFKNKNKEMSPINEKYCILLAKNPDADFITKSSTKIQTFYRKTTI